MTGPAADSKHSVRRRLIVLLALIVGGFATGAASGIIPGRFILPSHRKPMTIEYEAVSQKVPLYYTFFYRSDGRHVEAYRYRQSVDGLPPATRIIEDPAQRRRTTVNIPLNITSSSLVPETAVAGSLRPPSPFANRWSCRHEIASLVPGGESTECHQSDQKYLGYSVWKVATTLGRPPNQVVMEFLLAPALDWHFVQRTLRRGRDGDISTVKATRITEGEPDPSLFAVPSNSKVVAPKELSHLLRDPGVGNSRGR